MKDQIFLLLNKRFQNFQEIKNFENDLTTTNYSINSLWKIEQNIFLFELRLANGNFYYFVQEKSEIPKLPKGFEDIVNAILHIEEKIKNGSSCSKNWN